MARIGTTIRRPAAPQAMIDRSRQLRFALLERVALPIGIGPMRALVRSWRLDLHDPAMFDAARSRPRLIVATCHGMLLHLLTFTRLPTLRHRRFVVLLSPSRDGRLLAAFLARFGVDHAVGTTGSRGVAGARAFLRRVAAGDIGVVAVDGPRGPCGRVSPGIARMAAVAGADLHLVVTGAAPGVTLPSWDRAHLPAPWARVRAWSEAVPLDAADAAAMEERLRFAARLLDSPVLPALEGRS